MTGASGCARVSERPVTGPRIVLDVGGQLAGQVVNLALGVAATLIVIRTLGVRGFGEWSTVFAVVQIAGYAGDLGFEQIATRRAALEPERESSWVGAAVTLHVLLAIPTAIVCLAVIALISTSSEMTVTGLLVTATVLTGAPSSIRMLFRLRMRNRLYVAIVIAHSVVWTGAVIAIAAGGGGMLALAAAFLAVAFLTILVEVRVALRLGEVRLRGVGELWRPLFVSSLPLGVATLVLLAVASIDQVIVFEFSGTEDAGLYGATYRILSQAEFAPAAVMTTLFPLLVALEAADPARVRDLVQGAIDAVALISLPVLGFAIVAAEPAIRLLLGPSFSDAAPLLPILMGALVPLFFAAIAIEMLTAFGMQRRLLGVALGALALNVALNLALVPRFGFLAAAWVTVATELLLLAFTAPAVLRKVGLQPGLRRIARGALAAGGMALIVWALRAAGAPIGALLAAAVIVYPALVLALRVVDPKDIVRVATR